MTYRLGESGWESNPPRPATRPATGFEDQEAHRDLTTPVRKDNRRRMVLQAGLSEGIKVVFDFRALTDRTHAKTSTSSSVLTAIPGVQEMSIELTPNPVLVN